MRYIAVLVTLIAGLLLPVFGALAGGKTLEFQLVTKYLDPRTLDAPNVEGQTITQSKAFGVGVFKDGRIVTKDFVMAGDSNKGAGTSYGYSTYTFDDGSSVTARFVYDFKPNQGHGEYTILSGTGAYAGATGTGTLDRASTQFKGVGFFNIKLNVVTP